MTASDPAAGIELLAPGSESATGPAEVGTPGTGSRTWRDPVEEGTEPGAGWARARVPEEGDIESAADWARASVLEGEGTESRRGRSVQTEAVGRTGSDGRGRTWAEEGRSFARLGAS